MTSNIPPVFFDHQFEEPWFHHPMQMPAPSQSQEEQLHRSKRPRISSFPPAADVVPQNPNPSAANPTPSIFFKTRPCKMFDQGHCPHGQNCTFAHGPQDLRQPPPNWREFVARDSSLARVCAGGEVSSHGSDKRSMFWKTRLCHKFEKNGHCTYGDTCQYAHGLAELKKLGADTNTRRASFEITPSKCPPEVARAPPPPPPPPPPHAATPAEGNDQESARNFNWPKKLFGIYADDWI